MATVSIELDEDQARRLRALSAALRRPEEDLAREAVRQYLDDHADSARPDRNGGYKALRAMIGLAGSGPDDLSVVHDVRRDDPK